MNAEIAFYILAMLLVSGQQSPTGTAVPNANQAETSVEAKSEKSKPRCKYELVLGSKIPQRVCMTEAAWQELERTTQQEMLTLSNRNSWCPAQGPC